MNRPLALITGASSGIGAAYARNLADSHDLVLVARRADRLSGLAEELGPRGAAVEVLAADLGTHDGIDTVTKRLDTGDVRLLISNAVMAATLRSPMSTRPTSTGCSLSTLSLPSVWFVPAFPAC